MRNETLLTVLAVVLSGGIAFAGLTNLQVAQQRLLALEGQKQMIDANYNIQSDMIATQIAQANAQVAKLNSVVNNSSN